MPKSTSGRNGLGGELVVLVGQKKKFTGGTRQKRMKTTELVSGMETRCKEGVR